MTHYLHLESSVSFDDAVSLLRNRYPSADVNGPVVSVGDTVTLTWDDAKHLWEIDAPQEREGEFAPALADGYGLNRAFAGGIPTGMERDILEWALSAVRRFGGKLETDSHFELKPHQFMLSNLQVVAAYELEPQQLLEVVRTVIREATVPEEAQEAPYEISLPIFNHADLQVRVEPLEYAIPAIAHVEWVQEGAVTYLVQYLPDEPGTLVADDPEPAQVKEWREAYLGCAAIAKAIHDEVGGFVLDSEGYLVDPGELF